MKRIVSLLLIAAEGAALYLWQWEGLLGAGRILIFYLWAIAVYQLVLAGFAFVGAASLGFNVPKPKVSAIARAWTWFVCAVRVCVLVAIAHPALAGVYLMGAILSGLVVAICDEKPPAKSA